MDKVLYWSVLAPLGALLWVVAGGVILGVLSRIDNHFEELVDGDSEARVFGGFVVIFWPIAAVVLVAAGFGWVLVRVAGPVARLVSQVGKKK